MAYKASITRRNYYPVKTFMTKTKSHYEKAVEYYEAKQETFRTILIQQVNNIGGTYHNAQLQTLQGMFNNETTRLDKTFFKGWSEMYNSHWNPNKLQPALQKFNSATLALSASMMEIDEGVDLINYLNYSLNGANSSKISAPMYSDLSLSAVRYISSNGLNTLINTYTGPIVGKKIQEYNGYKASAFGELFEELLEGGFKGAIGDLLNVLNIGGELTGMNLSGAAGPKYTQGKTDILLSITPVIIDKDSDGRAIGKTTDANGKPITVTLDADDLIDLDTNDSTTLQEIINKKAEFAGIGAKQWTLSPILNSRLSASSRKYSASMGSFALTRDKANAREYYEEDGEGYITEYFSTANKFTQYTGYLVSKYLINVIGELNIFMAFGDQLMTTSHFLNSLYLKGQQGRRYVIAHKQKRASKGTGKDKGGRKKHDSKIYIADSGLVVAYVYDSADLT